MNAAVEAAEPFLSHFYTFHKFHRRDPRKYPTHASKRTPFHLCKNLACISEKDGDKRSFHVNDVLPLYYFKEQRKGSGSRGLGWLNMNGENDLAKEFLFFWFSLSSAF